MSRAGMFRFQSNEPHKTNNSEEGESRSRSNTIGDNAASNKSNNRNSIVDAENEGGDNSHRIQHSQSNPNIADSEDGVQRESIPNKTLATFQFLSKELGINEDLMMGCKCALQGDAPVKGFLYVTESCCFFYSMHLKEKTLEYIKYEKIVSIEKNQVSFMAGICIQTEKDNFSFNAFRNIDIIFKKLNNYLEKFRQKTSSSNKSSDSGEEVITIASDDICPTSTSSVLIPNDAVVECDCEEHLEREFLNKIYYANPQEVFEALFGEKSNFMKEFLVVRKKATKMVDPAWGQGDKDTIGKRMLTYNLPLKKNSVGPTNADMEEIQTVYKKEANHLYVATTSTCAPYITYGDCFDSVCKYCITSNGKGKCRVKITASVVWRRSVMMIQGYITTKTYEGIGESMEIMEAQLDQYFGNKPLSAMNSNASITSKNSVGDISLSEHPTNVASVDQDVSRLTLLQQFMSVHLDNVLISIAIMCGISFLFTLFIFFNLPQGGVCDIDEKTAAFSRHFDEIKNDLESHVLSFSTSQNKMAKLLQNLKAAKIK